MTKHCAICECTVRVHNHRGRPRTMCRDCARLTHNERQKKVEALKPKSIFERGLAKIYNWMGRT
ncbi:hypothetical protein MUP79_08660 [Candidatus Bathyarchaeota archaeon]|nr:hypothetical protein [Candidatus Bathyarchaeota archaeon]